MKPKLHMDYQCPACDEWIEILPTTQKDDFRCPWCGERLRLDEDLSKLVTKGSHWDE